MQDQGGADLSLFTMHSPAQLPAVTTRVWRDTTGKSWNTLQHHWWGVARSRSIKKEDAYTFGIYLPVEEWSIKGNNVDGQKNFYCVVGYFGVLFLVVIRRGQEEKDADTHDSYNLLDARMCSRRVMVMVDREAVRYVPGQVELRKNAFKQWNQHWDETISHSCYESCPVWIPGEGKRKGNGLHYITWCGQNRCCNLSTRS